MKIVGVDENGLGPLLGPLVTTAVTVETARYSQKRHGALGRELGIDDSKNTAGFGRMAVAEGLTLALLAAACGRVCADVDELFGALLLDARDALTRPCPDSTRSQCWSRPLALPCFGGDVEEGREMLRKLQRRGVEITHVRSALACTGVLNTLLSRGQSRVEVDLELMERLVLDAREQAGEELAAICGMVGGIRNYLAKMRHFPLRGVAALKVPRPTLAFAVTGVGRVAFEIDADANHMPVALASMVGKYVRELWMARQNAFYLQHDTSLEEVSGYHDPVTQRFIGQTVQLRAKLGIVDDCFVRKAAKHLPVDDRQLALLEEE